MALVSETNVASRSKANEISVNYNNKTNLAHSLKTIFSINVAWSKSIPLKKKKYVDSYSERQTSL